MALASYRRTVEEIYRAASDPGHWSKILAQISDYVGGSGALIAHHDLSSGVGGILSARLRDDLGELYVRHYGRNPYSVAILRHPAGTAQLGRDLVRHESIRRTAFHADILAPQGIVDKVMLGHAPFMTPTHTGGFAVMLNSRAAEDGEPRRQRMSRIAPHLSAMLEISRSVAALSSSQRRLQFLIDAMPIPAIIVDAEGKVESLNAAAEALLTEGDGLTMAAGTMLTASIDNERAKFAKILATAGQTGSSPSLHVIARAGKPPLLIKAIPLPPAAKEALWSPYHRTSILLQILDPDGAGHSPGGNAALDSFGLTASETRVALLIGQGMSTPHAATRLGTSVATVRTHLAHCFEKLGVRSQSGLARLLAQLNMLK